MTYIEPISAVLLLIALAVVYRFAKGRPRRLMLAAVLALGLALWPPAAWLASRPLEMWYPIRPLPAAPADAIVVFAAGVDPPDFERPYTLPHRDTFERCKHAAWLYGHWRAVPVLASGGRQPGTEPFSRVMRDLLVESGVPEAMIWTEEMSHSTHENAVFSARLLHAHGISRVALVVDAQSMPRAAACLRKAGIAVVPAPSSFYQLQMPDDILPGWKALETNELTLHESLGLLYYRLRGWA